LDSGSASPSVSEGRHSADPESDSEEEGPQPDVIGRKSSWMNYPTTPMMSAKHKLKAPGVLTREGDPAYRGSLDEWDSTWEATGAFDAITKIVQVFGPENVFIVSKVRPGGNMHRRMEQWLHETVDFCKETGVRKENINFVRCVDGPEGKGAASALLGLSYFVDDRIDVLRSLWEDSAGNVKNLIERHQGLLIHFAKGGYGSTPPHVDYGSIGPSMRRFYHGVPNWAGVLAQLNAGLSGPPAAKKHLLVPASAEELRNKPVRYPANSSVARAQRELPPWARGQTQMRVVQSPTAWRATSAQAPARDNAALQWTDGGRPKLVLKPRTDKAAEDAAQQPPQHRLRPTSPTVAIPARALSPSAGVRRPRVCGR